MNTNQTSNQVWSYARSSDGTLTFTGKFATQGAGSNTQKLDSQGSIALSRNGKYLFVVNAGSNEISSFLVGVGGQLTFAAKVGSGGLFPNSLAIFGNLLYVLNSNSSRINAFRVSSSGAMTAISNSSRRLSAPGAGGAQISFSNDGKLLVVAERLASKISTYTVGTDGRATGPLVQNSVGTAPFGFAFDNGGHIVFSEVRNSTISSYSISSSGVLTPITSSLSDFGSAACWTVNTNNPGLPNQYSYITNTRADTITGLRINADGSVALLNTDGRTFVLPFDSFPLDEAISSDSKYLYALEGHLVGVVGMQIQPDGSLVEVNTVTGLPASSFGIIGN